jgi:hypothetical protein
MWVEQFLHSPKCLCGGHSNKQPTNNPKLQSKDKCFSTLTSYLYLSHTTRWFRNPLCISRSTGQLKCDVHAQKPDFFFRRNGRVHLNRRRLQLIWLLTAEVCSSAVVMLDTPFSEVVWRVVATHSIRQFPLHSPSRASPCAITFQLEFTKFRRGG